MGIKCCKDCVPPKRHVGCHAKCEQYLKEKAEHEKMKEWEHKSKYPMPTTYDYEEIRYVNCKRHKREPR